MTRSSRCLESMKPAIRGLEDASGSLKKERWVNPTSSEHGASSSANRLVWLRGVPGSMLRREDSGILQARRMGQIQRAGGDHVHPVVVVWPNLGFHLYKNARFLAFFPFWGKGPSLLHSFLCGPGPSCAKPWTPCIPQRGGAAGPASFVPGG